MIDTHHHFWHYDPVEFSWLPDTWANTRRDFLPGDLAPVLRSHEVDAVISVQARQLEEETSWLLSLAEANPFIAGVVGWLPITASEFPELLGKFNHRRLVGLRHVVQGEPDGFLARADFNSGIRHLTQRQLAYDILVTARQLPEVIHFVDLHPDQTFIVDHLAKPSPPFSISNLDPWRVQITEFAKRPNVFMKLSGGVIEACPSAYKSNPSELVPYLDVVLSAFTPSRLMFGSNWPLTEIEGNTYSSWLRFVQSWSAPWSATERHALFHQTAKTAYRLTDL